MTLQLQRFWEDKTPTFFTELVWAGLIENHVKFPYGTLGEGYEDDYKKHYFEIAGRNWDEEQILPEVDRMKIHSIREDIANRWKIGYKIHFKQWSDRPYFSPNINFAPLVDVKSIQRIKIEWFNQDSDYPRVIIDGKKYHYFEKEGSEVIKQIALNDGFENEEKFFQYFNSDFSGKIIHWTDKKY